MGSSAPAPMPERSSATRPLRASPCLASVFRAEVPGCSEVAETMSAASTTPAALAPSQRWRTTS
jgi:hypothetical protein